MSGKAILCWRVQTALVVAMAAIAWAAPGHLQERGRDGLRTPRDFSVEPNERPAFPGTPRPFQRAPDAAPAPSAPQEPALDRSVPPPPARFDPLRCPPGRSPTFCE
ncbi:MAG TPA: hypothetical protein VLG66_18095 [Alphaproteobacteria bacterium]|nr:hypothetical protein [Alphaproteobacteria bacterium]